MLRIGGRTAIRIETSRESSSGSSTSVTQPAAAVSSLFRVTDDELLLQAEVVRERPIAFGRREIAGHRLRGTSLPDIVKSKKATRRPKDP